MGAEFPIKIKREARRPGDPASLISKNEKAKKILNWHPGYPELEKILRDAWHWHLLRFQD
jgi:UDP-glucose 4-epimerase